MTQANEIDVLATRLPGEHVVASAVGDVMVLLDLRSGTYHTLNDLGTLIWGALERGANVGVIVDEILRRLRRPSRRGARGRAAVPGRDRRGRSGAPSVTQPRWTAAQDTLVAVAWLAQTTVLFRLRGRKAVAAATKRAMNVRPSSQAEIAARKATAWRVHRAVLRAKRAWPMEARCLQTALTMQAVLRHHGLDAPVRVGVRAADGELLAHAWVELDERFRLDDSAARPDFQLLVARRPAASASERA